MRFVYVRDLRYGGDSERCYVIVHLLCELECIIPYTGYLKENKFFLTIFEFPDGV
jgi:hypothetical protein